MSALKRFGCTLFYLTVDDLLTKDTVFQIGVAPRRIDIITSVYGVEFSEAWDDCIKVWVENIQIPILSLDKLIKNKESTARERDALDAKILKNLSILQKANVLEILRECIM